MAANAAASFADILAAESSYDMPADDKAVRDEACGARPQIVSRLG